MRSTLLEHSAEQIRERDFGIELPVVDSEFWYDGRPRSRGRWVTLRAPVEAGYDAPHRTHVFDVLEPFAEIPPVTLGEIPEYMGFAILMGDNTLLLAIEDEDANERLADLSLFDLTAGFERQPTGGATRQLFMLADHERYIYLGGENEGWNVMVDDLEPSTPPQSISTVAQGEKATQLWVSEDQSTLFYGVGPVDSDYEAKQIWRVPLSEEIVGPGSMQGEVTGTLIIYRVTPSPDASAIAVTIADTDAPFGGVNLLFTEIHASSADSEYMLSDRAVDVSFSADSRHLVYDKIFEPELGVHLVDVASGDDQLVMAGPVARDSIICGGVAIVVREGSSEAEIGFVNHLGESPVASELSVAWPIVPIAPIAACSDDGAHALIRTWSRADLVSIEDNEAKEVSSLGTDVRKTSMRERGVVFLRGDSEDNSEAALFQWDYDSPEPELLVQGDIRGFSLLPYN